MHRIYLLLAIALLAEHTFLAKPAFSLQSSAAPSSEALSAEDTRKIDDLLKRYEAAYNNRNFDGLLAIWPELKSSKDFKKVRTQFNRPDITSMKVSLKPLSEQLEGAGSALVKASRTEEYVQTSSESQYTGGDLSMQRMPAQNPGPSQVGSKNTVRKSADVWIKAQKVGSDWVIASVSEKKP